MINVTKTYLPDFDVFVNKLRQVWKSGWITNNGALVQELELELKEYLGVKHLFFTNNGTIVLQMALKAYGITKEVITTPFSYVATTNAILWEGCTPVFADIDPFTWCLDPSKIEEKITKNTEAILATHVYGFPCDIEQIEAIAKRYNLKVIYDAAHAFGVKYKDKSLLSYGDISTCSFHATKLFHTVEGGCVITNDDKIANKLMLFRQFGHVYDDYISMGINGKNSEFHAAMGLSILPDITSIIGKRKNATEYYNRFLPQGILPFKNITSDVIYNYAYFPVLFESEQILQLIIQKLNTFNINPRRYFFPSLNKLPFIKYQSCPVSESVAERVLCLPLFADIEESTLSIICEVINSIINNKE